MKKLNLTFDLTTEVYELSKRLFNKTVRLIVNNGFIFNSDNSEVYKDTIIVTFPENLLSNDEIHEYVATLCKENPAESIVIITNNIVLASSLPSELVRIARSNKLLDKPKTEFFGGNMFTISEEICTNFKGRYPINVATFMESIIDRTNKKIWEKNASVKQKIMDDIELIGDEVMYFYFYKQLGIEKRISDKKEK